MNLVAFVTRDRKHGVSRDPRQDRGKRRCFDPPLPDNKNIFAAGLRHIAFGIQHDRLVVPCLFDFILGQDGVDVISRNLALGHHHIDMMARVGGDLGPNAVFDPLVSQIGPPRPGGDDHMNGVVGRIETHISQSDECQRPEITLLKIVDLDDIQNRLLDLFRSIGKRKTQNLPGIEESPDVLIQSKNRRAAILQRVAADTLKVPGPVVEGMGQDMHLGLFPRNHLSV